MHAYIDNESPWSEKRNVEQMPRLWPHIGSVVSETVFGLIFRGKIDQVGVVAIVFAIGGLWRCFVIREENCHFVPWWESKK
jgi:hypothetical protein